MSLDYIIVIILVVIAVAAVTGIRMHARRKEREDNRKSSEGEK